MDLESVWKRARADLVMTTATGDPDLFLWEHSVRVAQYAQRIVKLAVVSSLRPDEAAVLAAALYHDAGWAARWRERDIERIEVLLGPPSEALCEEGAALLEQSLAGLLPPDSIARASVAVRTRQDRTADSVEAHVLAEAENLQEFGVLSLWPTIRRGAVDGKGVQAVLDTWKRKKEYQFWTARLNDSFRFEPIRELAKERLRKFERLMKELEEQHLGLDLTTPDPSTRTDPTSP